MELNGKLKVTRESYTKNVVIIGGTTRSGKSMLGPIISSFERAENTLMHYVLEQIPMLHNLGLMDETVGVYLMRYGVDFMLYDNMIGRNANFRPTDMTSIWNARQPKLYFDRLSKPEGDAAYEEINSLNPIMVMILHKSLWHADFILKAYPDGKLVHSDRHPIDLVHSWHRKGYGRDISKSRRNGVLMFDFDNRPVPYYAIGIEKEYMNCVDMDRIICMLKNAIDKNTRAMEALNPDEAERVLRIPFEKIVTAPDPIVAQLCEFLDTRSSLHTALALKEQRCPRVLKKSQREKKMAEIRQLASKKYYDLLIAMSEEYEMYLK